MKIGSPTFIELGKNSKKVETQLKEMGVSFDTKKANDFHVAKRSIYHLYYMDIISFETKNTLITLLRSEIQKHIDSSKIK